MWWKYQNSDGMSDTEASEYNALEENSYRTEPEDEYRFSESKMKNSMREILERYLVNEDYDPKRASGLAKRLAEEIKDVGKSFSFKRYKLVARVDIGSKHMQQVNFASKFLWNDETDSFATVSFQNRSLYAVATVFGVYLD
ncbi:Tctex1 domain-containing protein 2 [Holothuria leucospilota]|uniref:Tctex1 domain-containing protein 2 n=1 Tax=Holothuria leucospilota TaxID=206669 RepID=A0A9Q1HED5_HOLLE|nr:Tctex1 domain-containing protein 2 [Holothuria leucospilota]